jgi:hypothetical protein
MIARDCSTTSRPHRLEALVVRKINPPLHSEHIVLVVLADRSALGLFVLAPLVYGVYYPQPYLGQLMRDVPIAVSITIGRRSASNSSKVRRG